MACYFNIKLQDGGVLKIPAIFDISLKDKTLNKLLTIYFSNTLDENLSELISYLSNSKNLNPEKVLTVINDSKDKNDFIKKINEPSEDEIDLNDIINNIISSGETNFEYINKDNKLSKISLNELLEVIESPISIEYLDNVKSLGLINTETPGMVISDLNTSIKRNKENGLINPSQSALHIILKGLFKNQLSNENFYSISILDNNAEPILLEKNENDPIIVYNSNNKNSIILGILKYLAYHISDSDVKKEFKLNKTDYFIGSFKDGKYNKAEIFNNEISDEILKKLINFSNITKNLQENVKIELKEALKTSLYHWKKGTNNPFESDETFYSKFKSLEEDVNLLNSAELKRIVKRTDGKVRDYYYSETKFIEFNSEDKVLEAYNFINNNITLSEDLILLPVGKYGTFMIPTEIKVINSGLMVKGYKYSKDSDYAEVSYTFKPRELNKISYKYLENVNKHQEISDVTTLNKEDSIVIDGSDFEPSFLKEILVPGSVIGIVSSEGKDLKFTVKKIHPGGIEVNNSKILISFNKIKYIRTDKDLILDEDFTNNPNKFNDFKNNYIKLNSNIFIKSGDIISYNDESGTKFNKVVSVEKNTVSILIKYIKDNVSKYIVKQIDKDIITNTFTKKDELLLESSINAALISSIIDKDSSLGIQNLSYFTAPSISKNGDYVVIDSNIYKIIDKYNNIVSKLILSETTYTLNNIIEVQDLSLQDKFITNRNIYSNNYLSNIEVNNREIFLNDSVTDGEEVVEAIYLIPKNLNIDEDTVLLKSNNLNIGFVAEKSYVNNNKDKYSDYKDVTSELKRLIEKKNGKSIDKLYLKKLGNYHKRFSNNLYKGIDFKNYPISTKENLLQVGAYVTLESKDNKYSKVENKTYRINHITDSSVELEYNTYSYSGKVITLNKTISKQDLLNNTYYYYLMYGNSKLPLLKEANTKRKKETSEISTFERKTLFKAISDKFNDLFNIPVETINDELNLNKKAWIETSENKNKVILNLKNINTGEEDLVHEYLHLFLFALKYSDQGDLYSKLLTQYKNLSNQSESNLLNLEEDFVENLSNSVTSSLGSGVMIDFNLFLEAFNKALINLDISPIKVFNIFSLLNMNMKDIFGESNKQDFNMLVFEVGFREWLKDSFDKNDIKMEC